MKNNRTLVFVSDVHSQHEKLRSSLVWCQEELGSCYFCFLGDLFDPRLDDYEQNQPPYSDSRITHWLVKDAIKFDGGVVLQSNHQDKLRRWLHHLLVAQTSPNPVQMNPYTTRYFVDELLIEEKWALYKWLCCLPHHVVLKSYDLKHDTEVSFLCSHAYFNTTANIQKPSKEHKQEAIYGLLRDNKKRLDWWTDDTPFSFYGQPAVRIAGHYHTLYKGINQRVIDTNCGSTGGSLCVHIPAYGIYKEF